MNKYVKTIGALSMVALLGACSSTTYTIKKENADNLNTVPKWYMADINETDACNLDTNIVGMVKEKNADKQCIYGVATAVSPDLQLAIEKAKVCKV